MKIQSVLLSLLVSSSVVLAKDSSQRLRLNAVSNESSSSMFKHQRHQQQRNLQFADTFNGITSALLPIFNTVVQFAFELIDPVAVASETTLGVPEFDFFGLCTVAANVNFKFLEMSGFSSYSLDSLSLVEGTGEVVNTPWWQGGGSTWSGTFTMISSMDELKVDSTAGVQADACGLGGIDESVSGNIVATNPMMTTTLNIVGSSPGFFNWFSSVVETIETSGTSFTYDSLVANFDGSLGENQIDLEEVFNNLLNDVNLESLINDQISIALSQSLSF